jgi:hypothetical protein
MVVVTKGEGMSELEAVRRYYEDGIMLHGGFGIRYIRESIADAAINALRAENERLTRERDALKQQAKQWAMEAKAQKTTVHECYRAVTGGTGEPGDWHGAQPVIDALTAPAPDPDHGKGER